MRGGAVSGHHTDCVIAPRNRPDCNDGSATARETIATAAALLAGRAAIVATFMPAVDDGAVLRSTLPGRSRRRCRTGSRSSTERRPKPL
jgi:hypothetical protein